MKMWHSMSNCSNLSFVNSIYGMSSMSSYLPGIGSLSTSNGHQAYTSHTLRVAFVVEGTHFPVVTPRYKMITG